MREPTDDELAALDYPDDLLGDDELAELERLDDTDEHNVDELLMLDEGDDAGAGAPVVGGEEASAGGARSE